VTGGKGSALFHSYSTGYMAFQKACSRHVLKLTIKTVGMKTPTPAQTPAKAQRTASPATAPLKAFKRQSQKRTYIRNTPRSWIPNSKTRPTDYLAASKALDLIDAATHARTIGLPLNLAVAVHFERGNLKPHFTPQHAIGYFLKAATQWLGLRGIAGTYVWVIEHVMGTGRHVHILMHCPPEYQAAFKKMAKTKWLKLAGMDTSDKGTAHIERVGPRGYTVAQSSPQHQQQYLNQLKGVFKYHLKGINPYQALPKQMGANAPVAELLGISAEDNQPIFGRRASQSQNISKGARDKYAVAMEPDESQHTV
jgi:hypothetical protein